MSPDGTITYGDRPPAGGAKKLELNSARPGAPATGNQDLPYALRGPVARHPVTLYVADSCEPCAQLRSHLSKRGVPFSERQLRSSADIDAFKKLGFNDSLMPAVSIGRQRLTGFDPVGVDNLLDAAGYPKKSLLTSNLRSVPAREMAPADNKGVDAANGAAVRSAVAEPPAAGESVRKTGNDSRQDTSGNRLVIPEGPKAPTAAPPLPARSTSPEGVRF